VGAPRGGEMTQALYAHMNNKRKMKKKNIFIHFRMKAHYIFFKKLKKFPQNYTADKRHNTQSEMG
jgi:hypothetical protein